MRRDLLCSWIALPLAATVAAALWYAVSAQLGASSSVAAGLVAAFACWLGALAAKGLAMLVDRRTAERAVTVEATLGMLVRMAFPMALCMIAALQGGPLAEGGVIYAVLVVYPVTLAVETFAQVVPKKSFTA